MLTDSYQLCSVTSSYSQMTNCPHSESCCAFELLTPALRSPLALGLGLHSSVFYVSSLCYCSLLPSSNVLQIYCGLWTQKAMLVRIICQGKVNRLSEDFQGLIVNINTNDHCLVFPGHFWYFFLLWNIYYRIVIFRKKGSR